MTTPTEIAGNLERLATAPFEGDEFPFAFALAMGSPKATVNRLKTSKTSGVRGAVLKNRRFHILVTGSGPVSETLDEGLDRIRADKANLKRKPEILLVTDGVDIVAEHRETGETLRVSFKDMAKKFGFFLPAAGFAKHRSVEENPVDVKATRNLAKLYRALLTENPEWNGEGRRHDFNRFMMRLIFCLFAEDVGIFEKDLFSRLVFDHGGNDGEEGHLCIARAFRAMDLPSGDAKRKDLPEWTIPLPYVNGGLFAGSVDVPRFDRLSWGYLGDAGALDWKEINPDIFGSMIQSMADAGQRSDLGMHYTSVPNILKVLGPLFLDDLDAEIEKARGSRKSLERVLGRIAGIRVFDPACGSGNFLVVAYRELRDREMRALQYLVELDGNTSKMMFTNVTLDRFHGIELTDFGAETARLALYISEYQANERLRQTFGRTAPTLPLRDGGNVHRANALRVDWERVCPPPKSGEEVFIAGNPPFLGSGSRSAEQKADMDHVMGHLKRHRSVDFVAAWFFKASRYIRGKKAEAALVSTNSICQGCNVGALWPAIMENGIEIGFAHRTFRWSNNASGNAAVECVIVGLRNRSETRQPGTMKRIYDGETSVIVPNINAYLLSGQDVFVTPSASPVFGLPDMKFGNKPMDGGNLLLGPGERRRLLEENPKAEEFVRPFIGSKEAINEIERYCIWVPDTDVGRARKISSLKVRFDKVADFRGRSKDKTTRKAANWPHRFREMNEAKKSVIIVPGVSSERRPYLPVVWKKADVIPSNLNFALYDAPEWCIALIASRLHLVWIGTVCGRLKSDYRYSNTMGWNTFPVPRFTAGQLEKLHRSARNIIATRAARTDLNKPAVAKCMPGVRSTHSTQGRSLSSW